MIIQKCDSYVNQFTISAEVRVNLSQVNILCSFTLI